MASVSVLLATFCGAQFLREQIRSLMTAAGAHDLELIVSDDGSTDETLQILKEELPAQAQIFCNHFHSPIFNFEFLIARATHEHIFLCDQDDVWLPQKIDRVVRVFEQQPEATLIVSNARVIDETGKEIAPSFFKSRGGFRPGVLATVFSNRYLGCAMAFRRRIVPYVLPFPKDVPMHDMWIGAVNALYGKTCFLEEPLLSYRRHRNNASLFEHANFGQMLKWRYALVKDLLQLRRRGIEREV